MPHSSGGGSHGGGSHGGSHGALAAPVFQRITLPEQDTIENIM